MKKQEHYYPVLFWYAKVAKDNSIIYHLKFENDESDVPEDEGVRAMKNAKELEYPVICIN